MPHPSGPGNAINQTEISNKTDARSDRGLRCFLKNAITAMIRKFTIALQKIHSSQSGFLASFRHLLAQTGKFVDV